MAGLGGLFGSFFTPIYTAGIITALAARMQGEKVSYADAMRAGLHHWWRLLRGPAGRDSPHLLGFLCFIIPGGILTIRYMLIDNVVVLEGAGVADSRWRSTMLTRGRGWALCLASSFAFSVLILLNVAVVAALQVTGSG